MSSNPESNTQKFIELGADLSGNVAGAAIGFISAGPAGAIAGAIAAPLAKHGIIRVCNELYIRFVGERGRVRAGTAAAVAIAEIADGVNRGRLLRTDGFFDDIKGSSSAEQILEGVLLKCRDSFEEKKILYIGNIFARAAFDDTYQPGELSFILKIADELTYRQFILLRIYQDKENFPLRNKDYEGEFIGSEMWSILNEMLDLIQKNIISGSANLGSNVDGSIEPTGIRPAEHTLTGFGKRIIYLLNVRKIPIEEVIVLSEKLK